MAASSQSYDEIRGKQSSGKKLTFSDKAASESRCRLRAEQREAIKALRVLGVLGVLGIFNKFA